MKVNKDKNKVDTSLEDELDLILLNGEIRTVYQPIVCLEDGCILGYEALSRGKRGSKLESPEALFSLASKSNKSWDLELLCRRKAIERAKNIDKNKMLFINVDPRIFKDINFRKGFTKEFLEKNNIEHHNIIFEITEKTAIKDYKKFNEALSHYKEQGYKIAIDDIGAGYSGLKMLSEVKPHYVKIDMDLIRDIHKDTFKQALIECFVKLSKTTNMKLIAEGIECKEELEKLIDLGVYGGQGFFLSKPQEGFKEIDRNIIDLILSYNISKNLFNNNNYIGQIESFDLTFDIKSKCSHVSEYLNNTKIPAACIMEDGKPVGLIMKHIIDSRLATQYGVAVFYKRPISLIMDREPIIVDYYTDVQKVSNLAMSRSSDKTYDCIVVTKESKFHGIVTVKSLLEFITTAKFNYAKKLNPLTGLPGNLAIQEAYNIVNKSNIACCILYLDLDNFKVYNDTYGFKKGDQIINLTAKIIREESQRHFPKSGFIGHIGGDDFICIVDSELEVCKKLCESIISRFDNEISKFFDDEHINNGYIISKDRQGNFRRHSLAAISIAGLYGYFNKYKDMEELGEEMALIKKKAKEIKGSSFILEEVN